MIGEQPRPGIHDLVPVLGKDSSPRILNFEDVEIQWDKGAWHFPTEQGVITKDTYSLWNPSHWQEIAERLKNGQSCAMMMGGAYGVGRFFEDQEWQDSQDENAEFLKLERIKQGRAWNNNFVTLLHPEDQISFIDVDRLPRKLQRMRFADVRYDSYAWAQHNIYPVKEHVGLDKALIREADQSIACFWIRNHWGLAGLAAQMRRNRRHHGIFGGGSLNFHGEEPSFTSSALKDQMATKPSWLTDIDFVIFDEIVEKAGIQRSQPMVSFLQDPPKLIRRGSLSIEKIRTTTGYPLTEDYDTKTASSSTPYSPEHNAFVDERVILADAQIARFRNFTSGFQQIAA